MRQGNCEECGAVFQRTHPQKRFCSELHQRRAEHRRYRKRRDQHPFEQPRFGGERLTDNDIGRYKKAMRLDPCCYCGDVAGHFDHIEARANGGCNYWWNLAGVCQRCNSSKGDKSVLAFMGWRLNEDRYREVMETQRRWNGVGRPGG